MLLRAAVAFACLLLGGCARSGYQTPREGAQYPALELFDASGSPVRLKELEGNVLLIVPLRMNCSASQALAGAQRYGTFGAVMPQPGLPDMESLLTQSRAGLSPFTPGFQVVHLMFFDMSGGSPSPESLRAWDRHFHLHERGIILVGAGPDISDGPLRAAVPGFQLVDPQYVLRAEATGRTAGDLQTRLLPMIPALLREIRARYSSRSSSLSSKNPEAPARTKQLTAGATQITE